jgi:putative membrane protein
LAVTALVVPGISGSFILLLLGTYSLILQAVRDFELGLLLIFITGAIMGLLSSARAIKYLYEKKKDLLLSIFFGLIIFCIPLIWQEQSMTNILEGNSQPLLVGLILGILTVLSFTYLDRRS